MDGATMVFLGSRCCLIDQASSSINGATTGNKDSVM